MLNEPVWVVIPAAGIGARMQADRPKQYLPLVGRTVIEHTLACFETHPLVAGIVVAVSPEDEYWGKLTVAAAVHTVQGGKERANSVLNALDYLAVALRIPASAWVLVHDAARPCLPRTDLDKLLAARSTCGEVGALLAMPVRDTMKRAILGTAMVSHTEERDGLWHALTPQMARLGVLRSALARALDAGVAVTDEASALEWSGLHPQLVEGDARNIKVTRPADLDLAAFFYRGT